MSVAHNTFDYCSNIEIETDYWSQLWLLPYTVSSCLGLGLIYLVIIEWSWCKPSLRTGHVWLLVSVLWALVWFSPCQGQRKSLFPHQEGDVSQTLRARLWTEETHHGLLSEFSLAPAPNHLTSGITNVPLVACDWDTQKYLLASCSAPRILIDTFWDVNTHLHPDLHTGNDIYILRYHYPLASWSAPRILIDTFWDIITHLHPDLHLGY
jgi:hypothetical protein